VDAEAAVRHLGRAGVRASILRIPGIYAPDREGGTPQARLLKGTPVLEAGDDVYTNHIHADDLARACVAALWRGRAQRAYHISDGQHMQMGAYFDLAADLYGLPRPPRIPRSAAKEQLSLMLLSFMSESRRLDNQRMLRELGVRLRLAPRVAIGVDLPGDRFGLQLLLLARQRLGGLLTLELDFLRRLAGLDLTNRCGTRAGAIGVGDLAGARIGTAQHLGLRGSTRSPAA
jgi:hypothetical protein